MSKNKVLRHRNLVLGLHEALRNFLEPNAYAHKTLERLFKQHKKWGVRDRAFVSEAFYEIIRWKRLFEFYTEKPFEEAYLYDFIVAYLLKYQYEFPTWDVLETVNFKKIKKNLKLEPTEEAIRYSLPDWMLEKFQSIPHYKEELKALNQPAEVVLRVNTLKNTKKELQNTLIKENITTHSIEGYPDALELEEKQNIFNTVAFKNGLFEIQDANSQKVAQSLNPQPGDRVIDACAGAGGKSLHMACKMKNKGQIIALDIYEWKLKELKKRAKRDGVHNVTTKWINDNKVLKRLKNTADKVLIDAPCSGSGVLKRNPDTKWKLSPSQFQNILKEQKEILQQNSYLVKKEGTLVYATCSLFVEENQNQIAYFLQENPNFELLKTETLYPSQTAYDGFFIAQLKKKS